MMNIINDLLNLIYPQICILCCRPLAKNEQHICLHCILRLPKTRYWNDKENKAASLFWGRIKTEWVIPFLHYIKKGEVKKLIHEIKYYNNKDLGIYLGHLFGLELINHPISKADIILPIPIHRKKLFIRGYNQSDLIAEGLSKVLNIPIEKEILIRTKHTESQTQKSRYDRWLNVQDNFKINSPVNIEDKHIILVDDVLTTGATLESCGNELIKYTNCKISFLTLAVAELL